MNWPNVDIAIIDYKDSKHIDECLKSIIKSLGADKIQINIVRVECHDDKGNYPKELKINQINSANVGYAGAVNQVITLSQKMGKNGVVIVINDDIVVAKNWLNPLIKQLENSEVGVVAPKIYFYPKMEFHQESYTTTERGKVIWYAGGVIDWQNIYAWHWGVNEVDHGQFEQIKETDFATGCCVAFKNEIVQKIGKWDERYFLYMEDVDWSVRVKKAKLKVIFEPNSVIWHKNAGSTGGSGSPLQQYYQTKSRIYFASKFASLKTRAAIYRQELKSYRRYEPVKQKAIRDAIMKKWGKAKI